MVNFIGLLCKKAIGKICLNGIRYTYVKRAGVCVISLVSAS